VDAQHTSFEGSASYAEATLPTAADSEGIFTDDVGHGESEVEFVEPISEDDEDILILNGGVGIPIGPVSFHRIKDH
jgi:hypothetical protein